MPEASWKKGKERKRALARKEEPSGEIYGRAERGGERRRGQMNMHQGKGEEEEEEYVSQLVPLLVFHV